MIERLGYVGLQSPDALLWAPFGQDVLQAAAATEHSDGSVGLELNGRRDAVRVYQGSEPDIRHIGWQAQGLDALSDMERAANSLGIKLEDDTQCAIARSVDTLLRFDDPYGYTHEVYCGPHVQARRPISRPADPELGHVFLLVPDVDDACKFFEQLLHLRLSDRIDFSMGKSPFHPGDTRVNAAFLGAGRHHHVLALASLPDGGPSYGLAHIMLKVPTLDEVGYVYDRCYRDGYLVTTIGRHVNDRMISFYLSAPGSIPIEFGCGEDSSAAESHARPRYDSPSAWGHHPLS